MSLIEVHAELGDRDEEAAAKRRQLELLERLPIMGAALYSLIAKVL
jgi:hypothetical protein